MEILDRLRLIINGDNEFKELIRSTIDVETNYISDIYSGNRVIDVQILNHLYNSDYSIDWLITGQGSIKRTFIDENNLNTYDKIIFNTFFEKILEEKELDKSLIVITEDLNEWEKFEVAKEKSNLVIYNTYRKFLRASIWKLISQSKYFNFIMTYLVINEETTQINYFLMSIINLIESNVINAELNTSHLTLNEKLDEETLSMIYQYIACLFYLISEVNDYTREIKKFEYTKLDVTIQDMRKFVRGQINEMENESFLLEKGKRYTSIVEKTFEIIVEEKLLTTDPTN